MLLSNRSIDQAINNEVELFDKISFAFLFGSAVRSRLRTDSDIDVAVYGDGGAYLEIETGRKLEFETALQIALERATNRNVDLLILNRAPATVCASAVLYGRPLLIRNRALYTRYFLAVTSAAIDFLQTEQEFREIRQRSRSLSELDRSRLERILDFIEEEYRDSSKFNDVKLNQYLTDRDLRRNLDRWVEMLTNAAIDVAKVVLSSELRQVPQIYGQILSELESMPAFVSLSGRLAPSAGLRNLLAHECLDIRFGRVREFVEDGAEAVNELSRAS